MTRNIVRGAILGLAAQAWHLLAALLLYAFLARRFGPGGFGDWRVVTTVLTWLEIVVASGVARVAVTAISREPSRQSALARAAYLAQAGVALSVVAVAWLLAGPVALWLGEPSLARLIRIASLDVPVFGLMLVASSALLGRQRFERQAAGWIAYATAKAVLIAVLASTGLTIAGALIGNVLSSFVGLAALFVPLRARADATDPLRLAVRAMIFGAVPFLAVALVDGLVQSSDLWLVSGIVSDRAGVGRYAAASILAEVPVFLFLGLNRVIFPSVSAAHASREEAESSRYALLGLRTAIVVSTMGVAFVAVAGRQVLSVLFSAGFASAYVPLVLLMVAALGRTVVATCTEVLLAEDERRKALLLLSFMLATQGVAVLLLAQRWGILGAAAGAAASGLMAAAVAVSLLRAQVGVRPLLTFARSLAAAALACAPVALAPSAGWFAVLAVPLTAAAYLLLLRGFGELTREDVSSMVKALTGRTRSSGEDSTQ